MTAVRSGSVPPKPPVPDKGTFFRVRLGNYPSYDDAVTAKAEFERKVKKIAYVSRI